MIDYVKNTLVVGLNYGDEGKGLITDFLTHKSMQNGSPVLNVLHNGGGQRGHTVELKDGTRHIFSNMGAGTFAGASTFMTGEFIVNPALLMIELGEILALGYNPTIYIDRRLRVSTPFDMLANQIIESSINKIRLGTCGKGIWQTILRHRDLPLTMEMCEKMVKECSYGDTNSTDHPLYKYVKKIRDYYLNKIGESKIPNEWKTLFLDDGLIHHFVADVSFMASGNENIIPVTHTEFVSNYIGKMYDSIIFEGGQGLKISGDLPMDQEHNTPSSTGTKNPVRIIKEWKVINPKIFFWAEVVYVSRTYYTRHGKGYFSPSFTREDLSKKVLICDKSNEYNEWQGRLRYAPIEEVNLHSLFSTWSSLNSTEFFYRPSFKFDGISYAFTHCDEIPITETPIPKGEKWLMDTKNIILSAGPTREHVVMGDGLNDALHKLENL